jgi:hypothetical protein
MDGIIGLASSHHCHGGAQVICCRLSHKGGNMVVLVVPEACQASFSHEGRDSVRLVAIMVADEAVTTSWLFFFTKHPLSGDPHLHLNLTMATAC